MIGIFVLILFGLWSLFAIWLGKLLTKNVLARFTTNQTTGEVTAIGNLITILLIAIVFILPVADQLIAYPKWQQLCRATSDFEWGAGMDEKKAFGKEVVTKFEHYEMTTFPSIKVFYRSMSIIDASTKELILKKPHFSYSARAFIYLPSSSGNKSALFLPTCTDYRIKRNGQDIEKKLQLTEVKEQGK